MAYKKIPFDVFFMRTADDFYSCLGDILMAYSKLPYDVMFLGTADDFYSCLGCRLMPLHQGERDHWQGKTAEEAIEHLRRHDNKNECDPNAITLLEREIARRDEYLAKRADEAMAIMRKQWRKHRDRISKPKND